MRITSQDITGQNKAAPPGTRSRGRWILVLLLVFFAVPLLLVVVMHQYDWHPQGSSHGELIAPARQVVMPAGLLNASGKAISPEIWRDKWSMVYIADECAAVCLQRVHSMRQLHVSFAKDIERMQRVLITHSRETAALQQQYPDLVIINQPDSAIADLVQQFSEQSSPELGLSKQDPSEQSSGNASKDANRLYLVDPLGNLMIRFPASVPDADVRKDISKLLRYSWAG